MSASKNLAFRQRFAGQVLPAITLSKEEEMGAGVALTENYIHAHIPADAAPANRLISIRIDEVRPEGTWATII